MLFPVRLDDFVFEGWEHERKGDLLDKMIADARGWEADPKVLEHIFERLLKHLRKPG